MKRVKGRFSVDELITPAAAEDIRAVIEDCGGKEVFILGRLDSEGRVCEIEPLAFGSEESVPAIKGVAHSGDVVIHNHPSGGTSPSGADTSIASLLAEENIGSYIVDNDVKQVYVIFRPLPEREYVLLDLAEVAGFFTPKGKLSQVQEEFEFRPQQVAMVKNVATGFNEDKICAIEAGTGVGKSFAYLIPAILWSTRNKERVILSTHTINLQEQLIHKDIPFLRERLGLKFTSALIKGRNNYICMRKVKLFEKELKIFESKKEEEEAKAIIAWAKKTEDGSLSDLNIKPAEAVWEQFVSEADSCPRIKCSFYPQCFFYNARRQAAQVELLVANHHLVMADIALRDTKQDYSAAAVLPPFNRLVFDEAHNLEAVATSYFGIQVTHFGITKLLGRLATKKQAERGLLPVLAKKIFNLQHEVPLQAVQEQLERIKNQILPQRHQFQEEINKIMGRIRKAVREYALSAGEIESEEEQIKLRITEKLRGDTLWTEVIVPGLTYISGLMAKLSFSLRKLIKDISALPVKDKKQLADMTLELNSRINRLDEISSKLNFFCGNKEDICYWIELSKSRYGGEEGGPLRFCTAPVNVGEALNRAIFEKLKTVIMTSATLTVDNRFDYFLREVGLEKAAMATGKSLEGSDLCLAEGKLILLQLDTPFRFEEQAFVGVPLDFPEPTASEYPAELERFIYEAVRIVGGGTLILFTSHKLMDDLFSRLGNSLSALALKCMKQGEAPRHKLLMQFREDINSVLFATASFWEGIDVKGEALRCLILTRLPFRVPSEPIMAARTEYLERQGRDAFWELDLPWAVMKFRQGFGRLIRSRTDRGAVLITDRRIITRHYGKVFLRSLPTKKIEISKTTTLLDSLKDFFKQTTKIKARD